MQLSYLTAQQLKLAKYHLHRMQKEQQQGNKDGFITELTAFSKALGHCLHFAKTYDKAAYKTRSTTLHYKTYFQNMHKKNITLQATPDKIAIHNERQGQVINGHRRNAKFSLQKRFYYNQKNCLISLSFAHFNEVQQLAKDVFA